VSPVSRRQLLGLLRRDPPEKQGFSLESFYQQRGPTPASLPSFAIRREGPEVPTSAIGTPAAEMPRPPWVNQAPAATLGGTPRVRPHACLAYRGFCTVCSERCPVEGALLVELGRPRVIPEVCTRCGACVAACPAPINGFEVIPEEALPPRKEVPRGG
jgi:ferredoxin